MALIVSPARAEVSATRSCAERDRPRTRRPIDKINISTIGTPTKASAVSLGLVTAIMISISGTISRRRAVAWTAAALVFTAVSIPSPVYVTGGPIQTIFAGNTTSENAVTVFSLLLIAVPLLMTGLACAEDRIRGIEAGAAHRPGINVHSQHALGVCRRKKRLNARTGA